MGLTLEETHLGLHTVELQSAVEGDGLCHPAAEVVVGLDEESRRLDIGGVLQRGVEPHLLHVSAGRSALLPGGKVQADVAGVLHDDPVGDGALGDGADEAVRVAHEMCIRDRSITDVANVVTNGPMKFESYSQNEKVVLVRNPEYYAPEEYGSVERMEFYYIADAQTSVAAFVNNELDVAINVPSDIAATHDNPNEVVEVPYLVSVCYVFTGRNPVLDDVRVRQAINKAINREQICEILGVGNNPIYGLVPVSYTHLCEVLS